MIKGDVWRVTGDKIKQSAAQLAFLSRITHHLSRT
jgi:hypothetical protein